MQKRIVNGIIIIVIVIFIVFNAFLASADDVHENNHQVKNIILMVPDGMGISDVTAARIYKDGLGGAPLYFETLENIGYQRTYSANSVVTDSAAAASAWACGEKFNNSEICYHSDGRTYKTSILELAKSKGKSTGLVATSSVTDATPAAFGAHVVSRICENEIARQYIEVKEIDVILGGGFSRFNSTIPDRCGTVGNFTAEAIQKGYSITYTKAEMQASVESDAKKILGIFSEVDMLPESQRAGTTEPMLSEMAGAALDTLENDSDGFFLLIEGSLVDESNHNNNLTLQISEVLAFDEAVKVVLDWIDASPDRKEHTLLVVVPDHETGGFAINGPRGILNSGDFVQPGWTTYGHTGVDTIIWSQGPGSNKLGRALDNTDLYRVMSELIK